MNRGRQRGGALAEALVAVALAGIALGGLTATAAVATRTLALVRDTDNALALATERLEALHAAPRADGTDQPVAHDGTVFTRRWQVGGGRGKPAALSVQVDFGSHRVRLATETLP